MNHLADQHYTRAARTNKTTFAHNYALTGYMAAYLVRVTVILIAGTFLMHAETGSACMAPRTPFSPARDHYDAAIIGKVVNDVRAADYFTAKITVTGVPFGKFPVKTYQIKTGATTSCGPNGPILKKNDMVIFYFLTLGKPSPSSWYPISWRRLTKR